MNGSVDELYLSELHSRSRGEEQSSLSSFGAGGEDELGTVVAVVTDPTGGIRDASDEFRPELGMPERFLQQLRRERAEYEDSDSVEAHNGAVEKLNLKDLYREHLEEDDEARNSIEEFANRVVSGEEIKLVCFEKPPKWCHRHALVEKIREQANSLSDSSEV